MKNLFDGCEALFQVKRNRKKDCFHRVVMTLVSCRLRVEADALKQPVKMFLVFPPQCAAKL
jgi:hypothetical protein